MNVKPLSDRVLILPNPAEEKTAGGLIIPDTAKEKPLAGKVIAVGPGTSEVKMEVKVGDQVLYGKYAGQEIQFVITEYNPKRRRYIGDRKQLLVAEKAELQKKLLESIHVGDVVEGVVKNVTDFGAFIDIGGADGLLHISEMSWGRIENPKKVFKVGDKVKTFIKEISGNKIALSLKFEDANPWKDADSKYAVGNVVTGKVARMTDFGAFVELEPGVDALLHVSQISKEHIEKPSDVLKVGDEVTAKVVDFNGEDKKISLSVKALLAPEPEAEPAEEVKEDDSDVVSVDIDAVIAAEEK